MGRHKRISYFLALVAVWVCLGFSAEARGGFWQSCAAALERMVPPGFLGPSGVSVVASETLRKLDLQSPVSVESQGKKWLGLVTDLTSTEIEIWNGKTAYRFPLSRVADILPENREKFRDVVVPEKLSAVLPLRKKLLQARRQFEDFQTKQRLGWEAIRESVLAEVRKLRSMPSAERTEHVRSVCDSVTALAKDLYGTDNVGFHYNLHGGRDWEFVDQGGIFASYGGDIALKYDMHARPAFETYLFQSRDHSFFDVLQQTRPAMPGTRMGNTLVLFDLNSEYQRRGAQAKGINNKGSAIEYAPEWLSQQPFNQDHHKKLIGIPIDDFIIPPVQVFVGVPTKLGSSRSLSRLEVTLATARHIEWLLRENARKKK